MVLIQCHGKSRENNEDTSLSIQDYLLFVCVHPFI